MKILYNYNAILTTYNFHGQKKTVAILLELETFFTYIE